MSLVENGVDIYASDKKSKGLHVSSLSPNMQPDASEGLGSITKTRYLFQAKICVPCKKMEWICMPVKESQGLRVSLLIHTTQVTRLPRSRKHYAN